MSRDIKFRAWDTIKKRYTDASELVSDSAFSRSVRIDFNTRSGMMELFTGGRYIIELGTGLKDKNGKEICEGDIIEQNGWPERRAVCYWDDSDASFDFTVIGGNDNPKSFIEEYEVVGNIHEGVKK